VIDMRIEKFGLNLVAGRDFDVVNTESDSRYRELSQEYYRLMGRDGVTPDSAREAMRSDTTLIGCMLLRRGDGDALICGTTGSYDNHFRHVQNLIGLKRGATLYAAMNVLLLPQRILAITDTYVNELPSAEETAEIALMAAEEMKRFGIEPKLALLSHSNFGSARSTSSTKMREARDILRLKAPDLQCDGEMHGDSALSAEIREHLHPDSTLSGEANLLVMPNLDAANIAFNLLKVASGDGVSVGPILLGPARAVHILTPSASVRRLVNITALAVVDALEQREELPV
jgi:malate dehydrogenase (oxaloacetate-decarboxylating)(NADP+)